MSGLPSQEREIGHLLATSDDHERRLEAVEKKTERLWQLSLLVIGGAGVVSYLFGILNSDWAQALAKRLVGQ